MSTKKPDVVAHACHPGYRRNINRRISVQVSHDKTAKLCAENN
jgi:hypothetical protein